MAPRKKNEVLRERNERTFANADNAKVYAGVCEVLASTTAANKVICFFSLSKFFETLHLSHLRKAHFNEAFADVLSFSEIHRTYGEWNICEYEGDVVILFRSAAPGEPQAINAETSHIMKFGDERVALKRDRDLPET